MKRSAAVTVHRPAGHYQTENVSQQQLVFGNVMEPNEESTLR